MIRRHKFVRIYMFAPEARWSVMVRCGQGKVWPATKVRQQGSNPTHHKIRTTLREIHTSSVKVRSLMESFQKHTGG